MNENEPKKVMTVYDIAQRLESDTEKRAKIVNALKAVLIHRDHQWINAIRGPAYVSSFLDPNHVMDGYRQYFMPAMNNAHRALAHASRALMHSVAATDKMVASQCAKISVELDKVGQGLSHIVENSTDEAADELMDKLFPGLDEAAAMVGQQAQASVGDQVAVGNPVRLV